MGSRTRRILVVALAFVSASLYRQVRHRGDILLRSFRAQTSGGGAAEAPFWKNHTARVGEPVPRLEYVRLPGGAEELLDAFEGRKDPSSPNLRGLPRTPRDIAAKYGVPETSRNVRCEENGTTTVGWIPNAAHYFSPSTNASAISHQGKIPRLIFQSWKTNELGPSLCRLVLKWSEMNPDYDYLLFDDASVDKFVMAEYGKEIFGSYACVAVGAAKCDVWRLLVVYLFGGVYFDADVKPKVPFKAWGWGERDVVTARSCTAAPKKHPGGCAHQWGLM